MLARPSLLHSAACGCLLGLSLALGCSGESPDDGGLGGSAPQADGRYVIEDPEQDCDDVAGMRGAVILEATGLAYEGDLSWSDVETGEEASRSPVHVEASIESDGTFTCIPYRQHPGEPATFARLSYDAASLSMTTDDGLLEESGPAIVWLSETATVGVLTLEIVRAFPVSDASGTFEVSPILDDSYENLVLVYVPSEETPLGHVSVTSEPAASVLEDGDVGVGVPHGFFPAFP
jgi:hypothetical protein